jgi:periplasmic divalent cation tolerance protein
MDENDVDTTLTHCLGETENAEPQDVVLVYSTFPSLEEARKTGRALIEARLAACVNIFPSMVSIYVWQGKTEEGNEAAMLIKTAKTRVDEVLAMLKQLHPYDLPARLVLPVIGGGEDFLRWIVAGSTQADC